MNFQLFAKTYILPAIGLLLLSAIFFHPQLQNKSLPKSDITAYKGMSHEMTTYYDETGDYPWWTNAMFGGMPGYQISSYQPNNLLGKVNKALSLFIPRPIGLFFLVMFLAYLSLLFFGCSPWVSFFGAVAIGFSTSNYILYHSGHMTKFLTIGYCVPIFIGVYIAYQKNWLAGAAIYGMALGLGLFANHPQMLYYMAFSLLVFFILALIDAIQTKDMARFSKATAALAVVSLIAIGSSASKILPTLEYSEDTMRGSPILKTTTSASDSKASTVEGLDWQYATNWSNGTMDVIAGFVPGAAGGSSGERAPSGSQTIKNLKKKGARVSADTKLPLYWGSMSSTGGAFYFGAVLLFLVLLQFFVGRNKLSIWIGVSLLLMIIMSMGRNMEWFNRMLFDYFPMFNKFRTPNSISSVMAAIVGLGAAFGLHAIVTSNMDKKALAKAVIFAATPLALLALFFALIGPGMFDFESASDARYAQSGFDIKDLIADRKSLMRTDAFRSLIFVVLAAGATYVYALGKFNKFILAIVLAALALFDMTGIGSRYLSLDEFVPNRKMEQAFTKRPVDEQILAVEKNRGAYRVYDLSVNTFNSAQTSYWHNTVGGYHPAKLQRFEDIKNNHLYSGNQAVLNMFNTKYIITREQKLQQNPGALGTAWFVNNIQTVNTNDEEIQALNGFDPKQTAIVHNEFADVVSGLSSNGSGTINMTSYAPEKLTYSSNSSSEALAVFSEVWYGPDKGWTATIDGQPAEILRANYILRALKVPAGQHEIVFEFDPSSVKTGSIITLISSLLLIGLVGFIIFRAIKNRERKPEIVVQNQPVKKVKTKAKRKK